MKYATTALQALIYMLAAATVGAADYPVRPITMLCWSEAGSPVDVFARVMAKLMSKDLGQNVVVETRSGADGAIMVNYLLRQPADGYTIAANTSSLATLVTEPTVAFKADDLQLVARSQIDPYGLIVPASIPFKTLDDFVRYARAHPGQINIGGVFQMSAHRVAWEAFAEAARIQANWVPYKGGGPALTAVAGGHVDAAATNPGNVKALLAAGKVRVLGVSSEQRMPDFPDVPTYKERGWNVVRYQWRGVMTRTGVPQPILERLTAVVQKAQQAPEWKTYLASVSQLDGFQGPAEFKAQLAQDIHEFDALKKKLGLKEPQ